MFDKIAEPNDNFIRYYLNTFIQWLCWNLHIVVFIVLRLTVI